jgi:AcrR family transcriptional regulator
MSHSEQTDLRIRRTHKFLQEAIIELITEKGFEAITVGDIAERAMINRATFYRHYQDKYDLVTKIFEETADSLVERMMPFHKKDADQKDLEHPPEIWVQVFEHIAEQSQLYRAMLGKNGSSWFSARMSEYIVKLILENEQRWKPLVDLKQQTDPAMPETLPIIQLSHVLIGTIVWWLESEKRYTTRQIANWFWRFAFYGYLSARGFVAPLLGKER